MDTYTNMTDAWTDIAHRVLLDGDKTGSRDGACTEYIGHAFRLSDPMHALVQSATRRLSAHYAFAELLWYLSGESSVEMIAAYAPQYRRFAEPDGRAHGAYGARWTIDPALVLELSSHPKRYENLVATTQIAAAATLLRRRPDTRQCVVVMWNAADILHAIVGDKRDLPCTVCLQFLLRRGALHCLAYMRSNDVWLGLPYDVFCFTAIQQMMASVVRADVGDYTHCVGSMHVYDRDAAKISVPESSDSPKPVRCAWDPIEHPMSARIAKALEMEHSIRVHESRYTDERISSELGPRTILADAIRVLQHKWSGDLVGEVQPGVASAMAAQQRGDRRC